MVNRVMRKIEKRKLFHIEERRKNRRGKACRIVSLVLLCAMLIGCFPAKVTAQVYWPDPGPVPSYSIAVMEVNTGTILYGQNMDEKRYPASITKILTALLVIENCDMNEVVTFSDDAVDLNEGDTSHIFRDYGEEMTVEQCLYAAILFSANECSYALAEHVGKKLGGDYQTFIDMMNDRAKELGCTNTHFANANGLPNDDHYTSAADYCKIAAEAYKNETFRIIDGTKNYTIPPTNKHAEPTPMYHQHMMYYPSKSSKYLYDYCTGGKTGYTDAAGNTLVTYAEKDGMTLVCVVLQSSSPQHYLDTRTLMDFCFDNFRLEKISETSRGESDVEEKSMGILNNNESFVAVDEEQYIVLPSSGDVADVKENIVTENMADGTIAKLQFTYGDHVVGSMNIKAKEISQATQIFDEMESEKNEKVVKIKPIWIILILLAIFLLGFGSYYSKKFVDNFYWIRHNREVKRQRKERFKENQPKKKKRRRKDILFK